MEFYLGFVSLLFFSALSFFSLNDRVPVGQFRSPSSHFRPMPSFTTHSMVGLNAIFYIFLVFKTKKYILNCFKNAFFRLKWLINLSHTVISYARERQRRSLTFKTTSSFFAYVRTSYLSPTPAGQTQRSRQKLSFRTKNSDIFGGKNNIKKIVNH